MSIRPLADLTELQGQYLAFIHAYSKIHRPPPCRSRLPALLRGFPAQRPSHGGRTRAQGLHPPRARTRAKHRTARTPWITSRPAL